MSNNRSPWESFLSNVGEGLGLILLVIAIVMLYRGCSDAPTLLPPIQ
jgi:hypothetical protein